MTGLVFSENFAKEDPWNPYLPEPCMDATTGEHYKIEDLLMNSRMVQGTNMKFIKVPGLEGKVYVPLTDLRAHKKHPCKDCFSCQMCTDDRCKLCREHTNEECFDKSCFKLDSL
jgi:hypothetical protein